MPLVRCKHFSIIYPTGPQRVGDVFELTKEQAEYYVKLKWVEILPNHQQLKNLNGKLQVSKDRPAFDLSKTKIFRGERIKKSRVKEMVK